MRGDFLRVKANFMIFITVFSIFAIYFANPAAAETASTQAATDTQEQIGCCADAKNTDEHCVMTKESECESTATGFTPTSCEQTSYCKSGCCVSSDGTCSVQVGKATCQALEGYSWQDKANCEIPQCQKGCCVLGGAQCFYSTEKKCKQTTSEYEALELDFRTAIGTEYDCLNICKGQDEGCCVSEEGTCSFGARDVCPSRASDPSSGIGFFKDTFCSNDNLECKCTPHAKQDCIEGKEEVFWFDSCGNREEIVAEIIEGSQNGAKNGDCDYATGTLCGKNKDGKAICKNLNCAETYEDTRISYAHDGQPRSNGESWCMYDARPGLGSDPVGSRHYRNICINGEEIVSPCEDARQEICKQGVITNVPFQEAGNLIEAHCVPNVWESCITTCNSAAGMSDADESDLEDAMRRDKVCCENQMASGNCFWMTWDEESGIGKCLPQVAPGGKFWSGTSNTIRGENSCETATLQYTTIWEQPVLGADYQCVKGCEVYTDDYLALIGQYCRSIGDCGAQYNFQGVWTDNGLYRNWDNGEDSAPIEVGDPPATTEARTLTDPKQWDTKEGNRLNVAEGLIAYYLDYSELIKHLDETGDSTKVFGGISAGAAGLAAALSYLAFSAGGFGGALSGTIAAGSTVTVAVTGEAGVTTTLATSTSTISAGGLGGMGTAGTLASIAGIVLVVAGALIFFIGGYGYGDRSAVITGLVVASAGLAVLTTTAILVCTNLCWSGYGAIVAAVIVAVMAILVLTADSEERMVDIQCTPWQPPKEGYDCESCDADPMKPCSEYRCKAIGQNCAFIQDNEGTNRKTCYNANPNDVNSPRITGRSAKVISHREDISSNFQLAPTETSTQVTGFKITPNVPPYSKIVLEIETNELSQCKIGTDLPQGKEPYSILPNYMPDSYYDVKHNYTIAGVIPEKEYHYYIACEDPSGNSEATVYGVQFTVDQGSDLTPPQITGASLKDNAYVAAGFNETMLVLYVDEQSRLECKWSNEDKDFNFMENNMSCASVPLEAMSSRPAECGANMQLYAKNSKYYFRCKDYPLEYAGGTPTGNVLSSNVMQQSFSLSLQKSDALIIQQTAPSGRLYTNNVTMQVRTQQGAESGKAVCYYNDIMFANTNSSYHEQNLANLPTNNYKHKIECQDIAGNKAESNISFSIDVDTVAPSIIGIHKSGNDLKIITDEPTKCQYSNSSFSYGMGTAMPPDNSIEHSVSATMPKYYITCADAFNNKMPEVKVVLFESIS